MRNKPRTTNYELQTGRILSRVFKTYFFCFLAFNLYAEDIGRVIAMVNNEVITSRDLNDYCAVVSYQLAAQKTNFDCGDKDSKKEALDKLIGDKLILDYAKKEGIVVSDLWVEDKLKEIASAYASREKLEVSLVERGLNLTLLRERIKEQYLVREAVEKHVRALIYVSPTEIADYYNKHPGETRIPQLYIFWVAKPEDPSALAGIIRKIKEEGIEAADKEYADYLVRMKSGLKELREEISSSLEGMKEGTYAVKKIDNLTHLIYLEKIVPQSRLSLEEAKEKIYFFLWQKKFRKKFGEWLNELKSTAFIKVYD